MPVDGLMIRIGEIGDMHTNPHTYARVVEPIKSDRLVLSTKYCSGDYYAGIGFVVAGLLLLSVIRIQLSVNRIMWCSDAGCSFALEIIQNI
jgi:hypothetical protein